MTTWEAVIGLEIHAQLATVSKIFSGAKTAYGAEPNTQACDIDLGMPGTLPVLNREAVNMAIKFGLGVGGNINKRCVFARKNYFYPDLPKGYQISQHDAPIVSDGFMDITLEDNTIKRIGITRAHLEEDAGKSLHGELHGLTGIDLNRAGTPLLEIVSEPDIRSAKEAVLYLKNIHELVRYLGICDGNMAEGSFRCDANVSVRPAGTLTFGTRTEIKNINSFRFIEKAINYEIARQIALIESGGAVTQETRLYDADTNTTRNMRDKEQAHDYRYFPDPDLLPVITTDELIQSLRLTLPELPAEKRKRFAENFGLSTYDAAVLSVNHELAHYFEAVVHRCKAPKLAANWVMGELSAALNKAGLTLSASPVSAEQLADMILRIEDNTLSGKLGKQVFNALWEGQGSVDNIIKKQGLTQVTDTSAIEKIIDEVILHHPEQTLAYKNGQERLFDFFVGQVMKATRGKANPGQVNEILKAKLCSNTK